MGRLQNLKHLNLDGCGKLAGIPREISQLTSLEKLELMTGVKGILRVEEANSSVCSLKDLTNLPYLMDLSVLVKPGFNTNGIRSGVKVGTMAAWLEMRHLTLKFDVKQHDVVMQDLPEDMQNMKKLQVLNLGFYHGISLPNCICDFEQLEKLNLYDCYQLAQLPPLERLPNLRVLSLRMCTKLRELKIGTWASASGFPLLESLHLQDLPLLESMTTSSSNVFWNEEAMPVLQFLKISRCPLLKKLPNGLEKLPKLRQIDAEKDWWEALIWEDDNIKVCLSKLFKATTGSSWKDKLKRLSQTGKLKGTTS
jgi:hypothetical protein